MNTSLSVRWKPIHSLLLALALGLGLAQTAAFALETQAAEPQFDQGMWAYADGHFVEAAKQLDVAASAGDMRALEVLGLMHLYGPALYGVGPWDKALGLALLREATRQGSEMAAALRGSQWRGPATAQVDPRATAER